MEPQGYILRQTQHLDRTLLKRQDVIRVFVITCVILAGLVVLVPAKAPAVSPMDVTVITTVSGLIPNQVNTVVLTLVFSNVTTTTLVTSSSVTGTIIYFVSQTISTVNVTRSNTATTTVTTYRTTRTSGTTTAQSTIWVPVTAFTANQTIATTASETVTSTLYTTTSLTTTSTYSAMTATAPAPPPIPGFPLESILAGLALGLLGVHLIYRNRRANRKHPS
jgi:hypothetical protein